MDLKKLADVNSLIDDFPGTADQRETLRKKVLDFIKVNGFPPYASPDLTAAYSSLIFDPAILPGISR
jgi:hypothetical protein